MWKKCKILTGRWKLVWERIREQTGVLRHLFLEMEYDARDNLTQKASFWWGVERTCLCQSIFQQQTTYEKAGPKTSSNNKRHTRWLTRRHLSETADGIREIVLKHLSAWNRRHTKMTRQKRWLTFSKKEKAIETWEYVSYINIRWINNAPDNESWMRLPIMEKYSCYRILKSTSAMIKTKNRQIWGWWTRHHTGVRWRRRGA